MSVTEPGNSRVVVIGEALIDLVLPVDAPLDAVIGGAPLNTARALARLGGDVHLCATASIDRFGERILDAARTDGVGLELIERCEEPTTLAIAELSLGGSAEYRFYIDGTSAPLLTRSKLDPPPSWVFTGGLGLVLEPLAIRVTDIIRSLPSTTRVMLDVNARPRVITDPATHRHRVETVASRCDVVKVSDEDLGHLYPGVDVAAATDRILGLGAGLVVVTAGDGSVRAVSTQFDVEVPVPSTSVVDTIGAGDTFDAGMLSWWTDVASPDPFEVEQVVAAIGRGIAAAAVVVGRRGADPPDRADIGIG